MYTIDDEIINVDDAFEPGEAEAVRNIAAEMDSAYGDVGTYVIPVSSILYTLLTNWYGSGRIMLKRVRDGFIYKSSGTGKIYLCFSANRARLDADLFGGTGNGSMEKAFNAYAESALAD